MAQKLSAGAAERKRHYTRDHNKEIYSQLNMRLPKDLVDEVKTAAEESGISQRQYIIDALTEKLNR